MADISLHEDSFSSWHTCPEEYNKDNVEHCKTSNENILKDLNLNLDDNSDDESIAEFEKIVDQSDAFNKFKDTNQSGDFLRPVTPTSSLKKGNSPLLYPNLVKPKYLNEQQQNISLADKLTPTNNEPVIVNNLIVPSQPAIQSSSITLVDNPDYDVTTMPGGDVSIFDDNNPGEIVNLKDSIKGKEEVKDIIKNTKPNNDVENSKESQGTFGKIFSYFKSFGKSDKSDPSSTNNEIDNKNKVELAKEEVKNEELKKEEVKNEDKPVLNNQKTLIDTVEALGSPNSLFTSVTPALLPVDSTVTVVNESDDEDEDDFVNAFESVPVDAVNKYNEVKPNTVNSTITPTNPSDIDIYGNDVVVEEKIVVQNPDGTETTTRKIVYAIDENGNEKPIEEVVYNNDVEQDNQNVVYDDNVKQDNENSVYINKVSPVVNSNEPEIDDNVSVSSSEDFVDAFTASRTNLNEVPQEVPQEIIPQEVPQEVIPQEVPQEIVSQEVPQEIVSQEVPQESISQEYDDVPPMAKQFREGTVKVLNKNKLPKKASNHTLKSTNSVNVELVPVNKPKNEIAVDHRPNYFEFYEEDSSTTITEPISKPPRKSNRNKKQKKNKKRKWYNKIFRFSICTRHKED